MVGNQACHFRRSGFSGGFHLQITEVSGIFCHAVHPLMNGIPIGCRHLYGISHLRGIILKQISRMIRHPVQKAQIIACTAVGNGGDIAGQSHRSIVMISLSDGRWNRVFRGKLRSRFFDLNARFFRQSVQIRINPHLFICQI